jgi:hypothetical protein
MGIVAACDVAGFFRAGDWSRRRRARDLAVASAQFVEPAAVHRHPH